MTYRKIFHKYAQPLRRVQVKNIHTGRHNSYGNIESKLKSTLNFAAGVTDAGQSVSHHRAAAAPTQKQTKINLNNLY